MKKCNKFCKTQSNYRETQGDSGKLLTFKRIVLRKFYGPTRNQISTGEYEEEMCIDYKAIQKA